MRIRLGMFVPLIAACLAMNVWTAEPDSPTPKATLGDDAKLAKLEEITSFQFEEKPLHEVATFFQQQHGLKIRLDTKSLEEVGIATDAPITLELKEISLRSALRRILRPLELTYLVTEDDVSITTPEFAETELRTRVLPVRDLVELKVPASFKDPYCSELIEMIQATISPNAWDAVGGPGSIEGYHDLLVISQTDEVWEACLQLLTALRELPLLDAPDADKLQLKVTLDAHSVPAAKIFAALDQPISLQVENMPLSELAKVIATKCEIQVLLDERALHKVHVAPHAEVTFTCENYKLHSVLHHILASLELTYLVQDEVLLFTSAEKAKMHPSLVLYPVSDLLVLPDGAEQSDIEEALGELIDIIQGTLAPNSWDIVGGGGHMRAFLQRRAIVVSNTLEVHAELEHVLAQMRKIRAEQPPLPPASRLNLEESIVIIYELFYADLQPKEGQPIPAKLQHIDTGELAKLIPELLGEEVWKQNEKVLIQGLADRLVIRQTRRVHRRLETLLNQLGVGFAGRDPQVGPMHGVGMGLSEGGGVFNEPAK